jgi:hypothetical protein
MSKPRKAEYFSTDGKVSDRGYVIDFKDKPCLVPKAMWILEEGTSRPRFAIILGTMARAEKNGVVQITEGFSIDEIQGNPLSPKVITEPDISFADEDLD